MVIVPTAEDRVYVSISPVVIVRLMASGGQTVFFFLSLSSILWHVQVGALKTEGKRVRKGKTAKLAPCKDNLATHFTHEKVESRHF